MQSKDERTVSRAGTRLGLMAAAAVPFACKVSYLCRAWVSSPVDRARLACWGGAALLALALALALKRLGRAPAGPSVPRAWAAAALPLPWIAYAAGWWLDLNALQLIASFGILWTAAWALYGSRIGLLLAPAAACAILSVPGSAYWMGKVTDGLAAPVADAFAPAFGARSHRGYLGLRLPTNEGFRRFFQTAEAHQYRYASPSNEVSVLSVRIGRNVHEVHPVTHCLRTAGWRVLSEELRTVVLAGRAAPLHVTEAQVTRADGRRLLLWAWYSSADESTGSFVRFRRLYEKRADWCTFQVAASVGASGGVGPARRLLAEFLSSGMPKND